MLTPRGARPISAPDLPGHHQHLGRTAKAKKWNVPDSLVLSADKEITVGRIAFSEDEGSVTMHSPNLPSMLSRKHAIIKYNSVRKCWCVEDLQSLNGVYINNQKLKPGVASSLKSGDTVCFGVNIDKNEFKYILTTDKGRSVLKRCTAKCSTVDTTSSQSSQETTEDPIPIDRDPTPPLTPTSGVTPPLTPIIVEDTGLKDCQPTRTEETKSAAGSQPDKRSRGAAAVAQDSHPSSFHSPLLPRPSSSQSTPGAKTQINVDALFADDGVPVNEEDALSEAIFGSASAEGPPPLKKLKVGSGVAAIQMELVKKASDKEKHALLSKIEALKSELQAKEQLLVERKKLEVKEKENTNSNVLLTMQEEFTCVICQELFVNAYTLPCAHSFCEWCIKEWMKHKKKGDCPICRKKITSDPVHSIVLDSAIDKIVEKLGPEAKEEREETKKSHEIHLKELADELAAKTVPSTSRPVTRSITSARPVTLSAAPAPSSAVATIVISSPARTSRDRPIVLDESSDEDEDSGPTSGESDSWVDGLPGTFYGGYGRCFHCGRLGHWAPGCPFSSNEDDDDESDSGSTSGESDSWLDDGLPGAYYGRCFNCGRPGHWASGCPFSSNEDDDDESDSGSMSVESDSWDDGLPGAYYGGYGHCFNCGRPGHWASGCPYA